MHYVKITAAMLKSRAYYVLSRAARQVLDRLMIECCRENNGNLIVTYKQFEAFGIHPQMIAAAIRELTALGFIEIMKRGTYRLTYVPCNGASPTNEWCQIADSDARMIAKQSRSERGREKRASTGVSETPVLHG
jgi:hypothetical protein